MQLVIDVGNTCTKVAVFSQRKIITKKVTAGISVKLLQDLLPRYEITHAIVSTVSNNFTEAIRFLKKHAVVLELTHKASLPLINKYSTPATLGKDRIANAAGAAMLSKNKNRLVIDAGTCLKFDFINAKNEYRGGAISPGLLMRYKSLHQFTARLPLIKPSKQLPELIGNSTKNAILSGVQQGMLAEVRNIVQQYNTKHKLLHVYLTGGDARYFEPHLKKAIFAPDLTLYGLNEILLHNIAQ